MFHNRTLRSWPAGLPVLVLASLSARAQNHAPLAPTITEPRPGRIVAPSDLHMEAGPFTDQDASDTHRCTDWEVVQAADGQRVWITSCIGGLERVHTHLGDGVFSGPLAGQRALAPETAYRLRVRFRDSSGEAATEWSPWSERDFTTGALTQVFPLNVQDILNSPAPRLTQVLPTGTPPAQVRLEDALGQLLLLVSGSAGGNLVSERHDGFLIDGGPDSWVAAKPEGAALCRELGLGDALIETIPANRRVYLAHQGGLVPMPEGVVLGVPTRFAPLAKSPVLSWSAKLRAAADLVLPATPPPGDNDLSLGELVAARLGRDAVVSLVEPLLAGIYAGDAWSLSAKATFPQLLEMAKRDRSLLRAARAAVPKRHGGNVAPSAFVSLRDGVGSLVGALVGALPDGALRLSTTARALRRGRTSRWEVELSNGELLPADNVVLGLPAHVSAKLVATSLPALSAALGEIPYTSAATVFFAYRRGDVPHALDATGFVVPRREGMRILAGTWVSSKWPGRAPEGMVLMRAFLGGIGREDGLLRSDEALVSEARVDLERLLRMRAEPLFTRVFRFLRTSPLPTVGHLARVKHVRALVAAEPGLHVIGSAYDGVGIPDTIRLATAAGRSIAGAAS